MSLSPSHLPSLAADVDLPTGHASPAAAPKSAERRPAASSRRRKRRRRQKVPRALGANAASDRPQTPLKLYDYDGVRTEGFLLLNFDFER